MAVEQIERRTGMGLSAVAPGPRRRRRPWGDLVAPYFFIAPFIVAFFGLFLGPALYSLWLSFYRYKGYGTAHFIGWQNYLATLNYHAFGSALSNTVFYWLVHVAPLMAIAFLMAVFVRSKFVPAKGIVKPILFLPNIVAIVAASLVFQSLFGTEYGVINSLLGTKIPWLQDYGLAKIVVVVVLIWRNLGFWFVVFLAGLTSISPEIEDAARVDGATAWQRMRFITIPLMRNIFLFAFVIDAINSFQLFTEPNVLMGRAGTLADEPVAPLLNLMVINLRSGNFGQASAVSWILFVLIAIASFVQFRLFRAESGDGAS
jgi:ABC-type sugar transport system permease subunit